MKQVIEISGQIDNGLWDYRTLDMAGAHLPPIQVEKVATIRQNGFDAHALSLTTLSGTYLETAAHLIEGRPTLDCIPVADLIRPARLLRLPPVEAKTIIHRETLEANDPGLQTDEALLIDTGWWQQWNRPGYLDGAPRFHLDTLDWFLKQEFSILGFDTPVADRGGEILRPLYEHGMLMIAPLVNLGAIHTLQGTLIALPLNIVGVCSAPCRAIFLE